MNSPLSPIELGALERPGVLIEGRVGSEIGEATRFYSFEILRPSRIQLRPVELNRWFSPEIQWFIRRQDELPGRMEDGFVMIDRKPGALGLESPYVEPGRFLLTAGTQSWYAIDYQALISVSAAEEIEAGVGLELEVEARLNYAFPEGMVPLELEVGVQISRNLDLAGERFTGYVWPGYWRNGYSATDQKSDPTDLAPSIQLEVECDVEAVSPFVL